METSDLIAVVLGLKTAQYLEERQAIGAYASAPSLPSDSYYSKQALIARLVQPVPYDRLSPTEQAALSGPKLITIEQHVGNWAGYEAEVPLWERPTGMKGPKDLDKLAGMAAYLRNMNPYLPDILRYSDLAYRPSGPPGPHLAPPALFRAGLAENEVPALLALLPAIAERLSVLGPQARVHPLTLLWQAPSVLAATHARGGWSRFCHAIGLPDTWPPDALAPWRESFGWAGIWLKHVDSDLVADVFGQYSYHMPSTVQALLRPVAEAISNATKTCPRCAEQVKDAAAACRFCGHTFRTVL